MRGFTGVFLIIVFIVWVYLDFSDKGWQELPGDFAFFNPVTDTTATIEIFEMMAFSEDSLIVTGFINAPSGRYRLKLCFGPQFSDVEQIFEAFPEFVRGEPQEKIFIYRGLNKLKFTILIYWSHFILTSTGKEPIDLTIPSQIFYRRR